jgi:hypothetical protein
MAVTPPNSSRITVGDRPTTGAMVFTKKPVM